MSPVTAQQPVTLVPWLPSGQLAERLGVSTRILGQWRRQDVGPLAVKLGDSSNSPVRYPENDVLTWQATDEGKALLAAAGGFPIAVETTP